MSQTDMKQSVLQLESLKQACVAFVHRKPESPSSERDQPSIVTINTFVLFYVLSKGDKAGEQKQNEEYVTSLCQQGAIGDVNAYNFKAQNCRSLSLIREWSSSGIACIVKKKKRNGGEMLQKRWKMRSSSLLSSLRKPFSMSKTGINSDLLTEEQPYDSHSYWGVLAP